MQTSERYARQLSAPQIGAGGQKRLAASSVLTVGAGGLGCPLLYALAGAGVGHIAIADGDAVSLSNLNRQCLYTEADIGRNKAECAAARLSAYNSDIAVTAYPLMLGAENTRDLIVGHNLILLAVDSIPARLIINDACAKEKISLVNGGIDGFYGDVTAVERGNSRILRTLYANAAQPDSAVSIGAVAAVIASLMANVSLLLLLGEENPLAERILHYDGLSLQLERIPLL